MRILKQVSTHCYMLESAASHETWGRYTFLGFDPSLEITCRNGEMRAGCLHFPTADPSAYLRQVLEEHKSPRFDHLPPFTGGLVGYFSYDYLGYSEPSVRAEVEDSEEFRDLDLMLFDKVIAFDHLRQKLILMVNMSLDEPETSYNKAVLELRQLVELLRTGAKKQDRAGRLLGPVTPLFGREDFCRMVEQAKVHIREGDIFQIVLSNCLSAPFEGSLFNTYRVLRTLNPSPICSIFRVQTLRWRGVARDAGKAGKRRAPHLPSRGYPAQGKTLEEDQVLETELLSDEKELAEHNMLVDLGRNDLGKISRFGAVQVEKFHTIERFSHVMHIGSTVRGKLREDKDALDAIEAVLPAGTLSGRLSSGPAS